MRTKKITQVSPALRHVRAAFSRIGAIEVPQNSGPELRNALKLGGLVHQETVKETIDEMVKREELIKKSVVIDDGKQRRNGTRYLVNARNFGRS